MGDADPTVSNNSEMTPAALRSLDLSGARRHAVSHLGIEQDRDDVLCAEILRAEGSAIGLVPRRVLIDRAARRLDRLVSVDRDTLLDLCRRLEWIGDLTSGPGGYVAPAPLRCIRLQDEHYIIVGGAPTRQVRRAVSKLRIVEGVPRRAALLQGESALALADLAPLGAVIIAAERWAGLDRVHPLGGVLADLDDQLNAPHRHVVRDPVVPWTRLEMYVSNPAEPRGHRRWKECHAVNCTTLVREKQPGGWTAYAWARPAVGGSIPQRVVLSSDEARRATFALDAAANAPLAFDVVGAGDCVELRATVPFPRAEYRYLVAASEVVSSDGFPIRYSIPRAVYPLVADVLRTHLGVVLRETVEA